jgi:tRNA(Ile2) C34 agmatinyltransferase TiaS
MTLNRTKSGDVPGRGREATQQQADGITRNIAKLRDPRARPADKPSPDICPECGNQMQPEGRCFVCRACGYSKCG